MISKEFIDSLNLTPDNAAALQAAIAKESYYHGLLYRIGITPGAIAAIMRNTDTSKIDERQDALNAERARVEWAGFMKKGDRGNP